MPYKDLTKGRMSIPGQIYFVTSVTYRRKLLFRNLKPARALVNVMREIHQQGNVHSLSWVIMPDHFHWLLQLNGSLSLEKVLKRVKGHSAIRINRLSQSAGPVWQRGYYDHALRKEENIKQVARYLVANPLRAGLVNDIGDYPHWDAIWL